MEASAPFSKPDHLDSWNKDQEKIVLAAAPACSLTIFTILWGGHVGGLVSRMSQASFIVGQYQKYWNPSQFNFVLDPWIKLIRFDTSQVRSHISHTGFLFHLIIIWSNVDKNDIHFEIKSILSVLFSPKICDSVVSAAGCFSLLNLPCGRHCVGGTSHECFLWPYNDISGSRGDAWNKHRSSLCLW